LSFPAREEWHPDLRSALHRPDVILFRVAGDHVEIVRVLHSARDIPNLLCRGQYERNRSRRHPPFRARFSR
jgi:plasmid stabilization system protein ParE